MENVVFVKYSNDRALEFQIKTLILEDSVGQRTVRKIPQTPEANGHVERILANYNALKDHYGNEEVVLNRCFQKSGYLEFEYLSGRTLAEIIDEYMQRKAYKSVMALLRAYVEKVCLACKLEVFAVTPEFEKVFGAVCFPDTLQASHISNIDAIFNNIIINDHWHIVDYEWVFRFPVPVNFVIYRAITTYINTAARGAELREIGVFAELGITPEEILQYEKMEAFFQKQVLGQHVTLAQLYQNTDHQNLFVREIKIAAEEYAQLFMRMDGDYTEENSIRKAIQKTDEQVQLSFSLGNQAVKELRIDPLNTNCIIENLEVRIKAAEGVFCFTQELASNAESVVDGQYTFLIQDPQVIIPFEEIYHIEKVELFYRFVRRNFDIYLYYKEQQEIFQGTIRNYQNSIAQYEEALQKAHKSLNDIENSFAWKVLKKVLGKRRFWRL